LSVRFIQQNWLQLICLLAAVAAAVSAVVAGVRLRGARARTRQRELERLVEERTATIAEQAKKLRELDRMKSQLFANVSHEFRSPLTLMIGPLQDALAGDFGPLSNDLARQIGLAVSNAQRLLGLVDQLLDVARLESGRLRLSIWHSNLAALLRRTVESFLPFAERRGIVLSLEAPAEPVEVWHDETQLEKVFGNLLSNALKFTPPGGHVRVVLREPATADRVEVLVQDDGPGIPADQIERIFDRFHQTAIGRLWPGAGIGLALSRQLIELHGGTITVESREGHGATFTVSLRRGRSHFPAEVLTASDEPPHPRPPAAEIPADATDAIDAIDAIEGAEPTPGAAEDDRTTVLVVDDDAEIRAYVRRHLEPTYRVLEAPDGTTGLDRARRRQPDLVISDVMMPGLDGNALFRAMREDPEMELIPVILLTAKASAESRIEGLRDGVDDYLVKPFDPRELRARVDNLIAARKRLLARFEGEPPRALRVSEVDVTPADEAFLSRVQATIEARLGDTELTVESLAATLACDRSYLLRKLRALTGETPSDLIRSFRLQRAEQLLRAGAGAVSEIAYTVGFKSVSHFSNAFQDRYGERPSTFAARHRSG
jgi:signal transduction histidine kinase/DNA-binding response OmpR family regulator